MLGGRAHGAHLPAALLGPAGLTFVRASARPGGGGAADKEGVLQSRARPRRLPRGGRPAGVRSDAPRPRGLAKLLPSADPAAAFTCRRDSGASPLSLPGRLATTCKHRSLRGGRPGQVDGGRRDKTGSEGREGARGLRPSGLRLRPFKGGSWLIPVLLKTLIFVSHPYGTASLAYLSAGLAVFLAGPLIAQLFTQLRESAPSSGESELW